MGDPAGQRRRCLNIKVSEKGLSGFDGARRIIFIAKEDIRQL